MKLCLSRVNPLISNWVVLAYDNTPIRILNCLSIIGINSEDI
jgi:hypothetical protein